MKILTTLLAICFVISNATLSWSGVCVNQKGTHSFSETSSIPSCHAQQFRGESHCFTLEKENVASSTSGEECVDLFFSSEANVTRPNQKVASAPQLSLGQCAHIDSYTPHKKTVSVHPDQLFIPEKVLQIQRIIVLLI